LTISGNIPVSSLNTVAYFSMEVGLDSAMPTYSGGLGVLAGDTLRTAADMGLPMICISLLNRKGYFKQRLDTQGNQTETPANWNPADKLKLMPTSTMIILEGRAVYIRAWLYTIKGVQGHEVPVYLLDTASAENSPWDQTLTDYLYGGDSYYRLCQEIVLGIGGIAILRAMGYKNIRAYHMNEGHSALLILSLLKEDMDNKHICEVTSTCAQDVRELCVFTTHTPVPAATDQYPINLVSRVLGEEQAAILRSASCFNDSTLNMTYLALCFSHYINGVSMRNEEISQSMYPTYQIDAITNGVHAATWAAPSFQRLYDQNIPEWRRENFFLRYIIAVPLLQIQEAHNEAKLALLAEVLKRSGVKMDSSTITIGFARRATGYKRASLLFTDINRLRRIARDVGPLQIIYSGKAHPRDEGGKDIIRTIFKAAEQLKDDIRVVYLEDYDMDMAKLMVSGVDLWLNTPQKPQEASGTSGMKAALNGVPSLSILDGWWIEGHVEGVTGWSIDENWEMESNQTQEITSLYNKLEYIILPMFYGRPQAYAWVRRNAIALNGSYFNAQRMLYQYIKNAYYPENSSNPVDARLKI
jgi:glycogen phosphorylase